MANTSAFVGRVDNDFCLGLKLPVNLDELSTKLTEAMEKAGKAPLGLGLGKEFLVGLMWLIK